MADVQPELKESTGINSSFDIVDTTKIERDRSRHPSEFIDRASLRMVEGPYDLVTANTDVWVMSQRNNFVAAISSLVTRIVVLSTRKLTSTGRNETRLELTDTRTRFNSARLFLHQVEHLLGLEHTSPVESMFYCGKI